MTKFINTVTIGVMMLMSSAAQAVVIDFNELTGTNTRQIGHVYTQDGYRLFASGIVGVAEFTAVFRGSPLYTGTPSLSVATGSTSGVSLTPIGGGVFSLISIDLDTTNFVTGIPSFGSVPIQVSAVSAVSGNRSITVNLNNSNTRGFQTITSADFSGIFDNVRSINFIPHISTGLIFDNILIQPVSTVSVNEPASLGVLGAGLIGLGLVLHKRSRQRSHSTAPVRNIL